LGYQIIQGDFNADGLQDLLLVSGSTYYLFTANGPVPDLLKTIDPGAGLGALIQVNYAKLGDVSPTRLAGAATAWPQVKIKPVMTVVSNVSTSDGISANITPDRYYEYGSAILEKGKTGRGFLGFTSIMRSKFDTNISTIVAYRQDWPYIGLIDSVEKKNWFPGHWYRWKYTSPYYMPIKKSKYYYSCLDLSYLNLRSLPNCSVQPGNSYFVYTVGVDEDNWDLDGTRLPGSQTSQDMDGYGNPLTVRVQSNNERSSDTIIRRQLTIHILRRIPPIGTWAIYSKVV
jgi:hypothetical protein